MSNPITRGLVGRNLLVTRGYGIGEEEGGGSLPVLRPRRQEHLQRGLRFANIGPFPGMDPRELVHGGARVYHASSVQCLLQEPTDKNVLDVSGAIRFRFRDQRKFAIPNGVKHYARGSVNQFGEPILKLS